MSSNVLIVEPGGDMRGIYSPYVDAVSKRLGGDREVRRASHVEPTADLAGPAVRLAVTENMQLPVVKNHVTPELRALLPQNVWWADMTPVADCVLGPFDMREEALAAEVVWLQAQDVPQP